MRHSGSYAGRSSGLVRSASSSGCCDRAAAVGLPRNHLGVALLTFNAGVEIGQLLVVALAYAVAKTFKAWPPFGAARTPALYAVGSVAAYWTWGRIVAIGA